MMKTLASPFEMMLMPVTIKVIHMLGVVVSIQILNLNFSQKFQNCKFCSKILAAAKVAYELHSSAAFIDV